MDTQLTKSIPGFQTQVHLVSEVGPLALACERGLGRGWRQSGLEGKNRE